MPLLINAELQSLIPPLATEEYTQLEANILADGCHDPLIVWQEEQTLLDGHHRYDICERHGLGYTTQEVRLADLDAAKAWIIANQLGRRNLTPEQMSYFRGKQYDMQKRQGQRTDLTSGQNEQKLQTTAAQLAQQHNVSEATIRRDAAYAQSVDTIAEVAGPEARQALLARDTKITQQEIKQLADLAQVSPRTAKEVMAGVRLAKTPKTAKQMIQTAVEAVQKEVATVGSGTMAAAGVPRKTLARVVPRQDTPILTEVLDAEPPAAAPATWPRTVATGDYEWYTPPEVLALVRQVLGTIEVDPASCAAAQAIVGAITYYNVEDDGLRHPWRGRVFCNPPYKRPEIARFVGKLIEELDAQHTTEAILLVNAVTQTDWFQCVAPRAAALCFPDGRMRFTHATHHGRSPCQGQAILYFGPQVERFAEVFGTMGLLMQVMGAKAAGPQLALAEASAAPPQTAPPQQTSRPPGRSPDYGKRTQAVEQMARKLHRFTCPEIAKQLGDERRAVKLVLTRKVKQGTIKKEGTVYTWVGPTPNVAEAS